MPRKSTRVYVWILIIHFFVATLTVAHTYAVPSSSQSDDRIQTRSAAKKKHSSRFRYAMKKIAKPAGKQPSLAASRNLHNVHWIRSKAKIMWSCDDCSWNANAPSGKYIKGSELRSTIFAKPLLLLSRPYGVQCARQRELCAHMCWTNSTRSACNLIVFNLNFIT